MAPINIRNCLLSFITSDHPLVPPDPQILKYCVERNGHVWLNVESYVDAISKLCASQLIRWTADGIIIVNPSSLEHEWNKRILASINAVREIVRVQDSVTGSWVTIQAYAHGDYPPANDGSQMWIIVSYTITIIVGVIAIKYGIRWLAIVAVLFAVVILRYYRRMTVDLGSICVYCMDRVDKVALLLNNRLSSREIIRVRLFSGLINRLRIEYQKFEPYFRQFGKIVANMHNTQRLWNNSPKSKSVIAELEKIGNAIYLGILGDKSFVMSGDWLWNKINGQLVATSNKLQDELRAQFTLTAAVMFEWNRLIEILPTPKFQDQVMRNEIA